MKIIFCNIAYMNHYEGNTERDIIPTGAGEWVKVNKDAHEKWNFLNYDGMCYGFVQNKGTFRIERFEGVASNAESTENVTVVWCSPKPDGRTVIVGWYENAKMYRYYQRSICTAITGLDRDFFVEARPEDCYLLPEDMRTFEIQRASKAGTGRGFGQQNYWYADNEYAKEEIIPKVLEYIEANRGNRINRLDDFFNYTENITEPLTDEEIENMNLHYVNEEYDLYLPLAYRFYEKEKQINTVYNIANALVNLFQFKLAKNWYDIALREEGPSWNLDRRQVYLYQQLDDFDTSIMIANRIFEYREAKNPDAIDELHSILADNYFFKGDIDKAVEYLDKIIESSSNENLVKFTKQDKIEWLEFYK